MTSQIVWRGPAFNSTNLVFDNCSSSDWHLCHNPGREIRGGGVANQVKNNAEQLREYPKIRERLAAVEKMVEQLGADLERARAELQRKADR